MSEKLAPLPWPSGESIIARRIRSHDWDKTPLGPISGWDAQLRMAVGLMLDTPLAAFVLWGADQILIYNDVCQPLLVDMMRQDLFGQPTHNPSTEAHDLMLPAKRRAMAGETAVIEKFRLMLSQDGSHVETWWRVYLVPIRDLDNRVRGVLGTMTETSAAHWAAEELAHARAALSASEARHEFLLTVANALRPLKNMEAVRQTTTRLLASYLECDSVTCFDVADDTGRLVPVTHYDQEQVFAPVGLHISDLGPNAWELLSAEQMLVYGDAAVEIPPGPQRDACLEADFRAFVAVPLLQDGKLNEVSIVHASVPRRWDDEDIRTILDVAERARAEFARLRAETALQKHDQRLGFLLRFSDQLRASKHGADIVDRALAMLVDEMDLDCCYIARISPAADQAEVIHQHCRPGQPSVPRIFEPPDCPRMLWRRHAQTQVIPDSAIEQEISFQEQHGLARIGQRALISIPLGRGGDPPSILVVAMATPRHWTISEVSLIENLAERLWSRLARADVEMALEDSEGRLRQFARASSSVLWMRDAETMAIGLKSPAFATIYGRDCDQPGDEGLRCWLRMILPEDRASVLNNLRRIRAGHEVDHEFRIRRGDTGELRWIRNNDFPIFDSRGRVRWIAGLGMDVTDAKLAAERQETLMAELQHRTRNLITVVRSLAERTLDSTDSLIEFSQRFAERLAALSRVQEFLSHLAAGDPVHFITLLEAELSAHGVALDLTGKVVLSGSPGVMLGGDNVQVLALALHELTTNAVKHGALSNRAPHGKLAINWHVTDLPRPRLHISWRETGVPVKNPDPQPPERGFGRRMIEQALPYQADAQTKFCLTADGLHCTLIIALTTAER